MSAISANRHLAQPEELLTSFEENLELLKGKIPNLKVLAATPSSASSVLLKERLTHQPFPSVEPSKLFDWSQLGRPLSQGMEMLCEFLQTRFEILKDVNQHIHSENTLTLKSLCEKLQNGAFSSPQEEKMIQDLLCGASLDKIRERVKEEHKKAIADWAAPTEKMLTELEEGAQEQIEEIFREHQCVDPPLPRQDSEELDESLHSVQSALAIAKSYLEEPSDIDEFEIAFKDLQEACQDFTEKFIPHQEVFDESLATELLQRCGKILEGLEEGKAVLGDMQRYIKLLGDRLGRWAVDRALRRNLTPKLENQLLVPLQEVRKKGEEEISKIQCRWRESTEMFLQSWSHWLSFRKSEFESDAEFFAWVQKGLSLELTFLVRRTERANKTVTTMLESG